MGIEEIQRDLLRDHNLRVTPAMGAYILRCLTNAKTKTGNLSVIGGDAKTGVPMQAVIALENLRNSPQAKMD